MILGRSFKIKNTWTDPFLSPQYDAENRLIRVSNQYGEFVNYIYDYRGRRVGAVGEGAADPIEEYYVWDEWNLLMVLDQNGNINQRFTWGLDIAEQANGLAVGGRPGAAAGGVGGLLAVEEVSGQQAGDYVYFYDANGNVGQVLDWDSNAVASHYEYDPFGNTVKTSGFYSAINRFRFSTKYQDYLTDFYYYGYRFYDPEVGRWLNRDPIKERGGLNIYSFLKNNPINHEEYLGLCPVGSLLVETISDYKMQDKVVETTVSGTKTGSATRGLPPNQECADCVQNVSCKQKVQLLNVSCTIDVCQNPDGSRFAHNIRNCDGDQELIGNPYDCQDVGEPVCDDWVPCILC